MDNACRSFSCNSWTHYSRRIQKEDTKIKEKKKGIKVNPLIARYIILVRLINGKMILKSPFILTGSIITITYTIMITLKGTGRNGDM